MSCPVDELVHIQLLAARGRLPDAAALLERPIGGLGPAILPVEVLRARSRLTSTKRAALARLAGEKR